MSRRTRLTPLQEAFLVLAKQVRDGAVEAADAAFNARQKVVIEDMDVPSTVTGTFERDDEGVVLVEPETAEAV